MENLVLSLPKISKKIVKQSQRKNTKYMKIENE